MTKILSINKYRKSTIRNTTKTRELESQRVYGTNKNSFVWNELLDTERFDFAFMKKVMFRTRQKVLEESKERTVNMDLNIGNTS